MNSLRRVYPRASMAELVKPCSASKPCVLSCFLLNNYHTITSVRICTEHYNINMNIKKLLHFRTSCYCCDTRTTRLWVARLCLAWDGMPPLTLPCCSSSLHVFCFKNARTGQPKESSARRSSRGLEDKRDYTLLCRKVQAG